MRFFNDNKLTLWFLVKEIKINKYNITISLDGTQSIVSFS